MGSRFEIKVILVPSGRDHVCAPPGESRPFLIGVGFKMAINPAGTSDEGLAVYANQEKSNCFVISFLHRTRIKCHLIPDRSLVDEFCRSLRPVNRIAFWVFNTEDP